MKSSVFNCGSYFLKILSTSFVDSTTPLITPLHFSTTDDNLGNVQKAPICKISRRKVRQEINVGAGASAVATSAVEIPAISVFMQSVSQSLSSCTSCWEQNCCFTIRKKCDSRLTF